MDAVETIFVIWPILLLAWPFACVVLLMKDHRRALVAAAVGVPLLGAGFLVAVLAAGGAGLSAALGGDGDPTGSYAAAQVFAVAIFLSVSAASAGAFRIARPGSRWAVRYYSNAKLTQSRSRWDKRHPEHVADN